MEYGDFKPHEADAFKLDHVIAYKQSSKFNSRNALMEVNLENFPLENYLLYGNNSLDEHFYSSVVNNCYGWFVS